MRSPSSIVGTVPAVEPMMTSHATFTQAHFLRVRLFFHHVRIWARSRKRVKTKRSLRTYAPRRYRKVISSMVRPRISSSRSPGESDRGDTRQRKPQKVSQTSIGRHDGSPVQRSQAMAKDFGTRVRAPPGLHMTFANRQRFFLLYSREVLRNQ